VVQPHHNQFEADRSPSAPWIIALRFRWASRSSLKWFESFSYKRIASPTAWAPVLFEHSTIANKQTLAVVLQQLLLAGHRRGCWPMEGTSRVEIIPKMLGHTPATLENDSKPSRSLLAWSPDNPHPPIRPILTDNNNTATDIKMHGALNISRWSEI
jgi:hypothetical protein